MTKHNDLATALENGDIQAIKQVVATHPELVNSPDWTPPPLHCTVLWNQPEAAKILLDHGADIELLDPDRQTTAIRWAVVYAKTDMISVLMSHGANTGPIIEGGTTLFQLAKDAAAGEFDEYDELPSREDYSKVVTFLEGLGLKE